MAQFPPKCKLCTEQRFCGSAGLTRDLNIGVISHEPNAFFFILIVGFAGEKLLMRMGKV